MPKVFMIPNTPITFTSEEMADVLDALEKAPIDTGFPVWNAINKVYAKRMQEQRAAEMRQKAGDKGKLEAMKISNNIDTDLATIDGKEGEDDQQIQQ